MYKTWSEDTLKEMATEVGEYVVKQMKIIFRDQNSKFHFVIGQIFRLKEHLDEMIKNCFENDPAIAGEAEKKYGSMFSDDYNLVVKMAEYTDYAF